MSFLDKNGNPLTVNDQAFALGKVASVDGTHAVVSLVKYGSATNLTFLRSEPIKATFAGGQVSGQISGGPQPGVNDDVIVLGTITALAPGIHPVANISVMLNGFSVEFTFYCNELIKASIDQPTGVVSGPS